MKLPFLGAFGKKEVKNHFLALLLQDEKVGAVILEETNGKLSVASQAETRFTTSLEEANFEEWLDTIDKAVSLAEQDLGDNLQTEKTVFGVKQEWIEEGKIKKEYLMRLKKVCEELALQPIGFLVFTEAILHLLQEDEGAPVSAILIEIGKKFLTISNVRAGRVAETLQVPFERPVPLAVDKALKSFEAQILPARIILYDNEHDERLTQSFISHSWSKGLPFIHMPQITVLPVDYDTKGVLYGTASQMGFAVISGSAMPVRNVQGKISKEEPQEEEKQAEEEMPLSHEQESEANTQEVIEEPQEEEFTEEQKREKENNQTKEHFPSELLEKEVAADYFGFVENKDVTSIPHKIQSKNQAESKVPQEEMEEVFEEIPEEVKEEETDFRKPGGGIGYQGMLILEGAQKIFGNVTKQLPAANKLVTSAIHSLSGIISKRNRTKRNEFGEDRNEIRGESGKPAVPFGLIAAIPVVLVLIIGIILWYIFGLSANVTILVTPQMLENKQPVKFAIGGSNDFSKNIIAADTISQDENGNLSQDTTGTKQVGTPAKGTVTVFNLNTSPASLSANTTIVAETGKKFTLDSSVSVPAADPFSGSGGQATVNVTAIDIGPDYNLPSGTKFTFSSSSNLGAKNDNPFTGGTKKDVNVVAQADIDKLTGDLTKNLETNARSDISKQLSADQQLLPDFASEDISKKTLSKNVGDQADTVSLTATVTYKGIVVKKQDLTDFAKSSAQSNAANGLALSQDGLQTDLTDISENKDTVSGNLSIKAKLLPTIDNTQITKEIAGKSFSQATDIIKQVPQIDSVVINLAPNLPFLPKTLPKFSNHIHIRVNLNE